jgi:argininosuccinate lyase
MWGGRFAAPPAQLMEEINASVAFDKVLAPQDIRGSKAHAAMLAAQGIVSAADARRIIAGLDRVLAEVEAGTFEFKRGLEDVHMNIESRLQKLIGEPAGRLHTGRSRNDQVATAFRLYVRDWLDGADVALAALQLALARKAAACHDVIMPGLTHLQPAQPITFGHHLLAYVEMLARDRGRFRDARRRLNESPLGAAALAGTSFPIDRTMTARELGFDRPSANSLDAVADRDFAVETLAAAALSAVHLSRFAEELILWVTPQFGFVRLSDAFTTGSSIMPQKRNPDAAELVRAKCGRISAALISLLMVLKGLPLAYAKDLQEDKELTFDALASLTLAIAATTGMVEDLTPEPAAMEAAARKGYPTATDLADWLVRRLGVAFREAHHIAGRIVAAAEAAGVELEDLPLEAMQRCHPGITREVFTVLSPRRSAASRTSFGGTAPQNVRKMALAWIKRLENRASKV